MSAIFGFFIRHLVFITVVIFIVVAYFFRYEIFLHDQSRVQIFDSSEKDLPATVPVKSMQPVESVVKVDLPQQGAINQYELARNSVSETRENLPVVELPPVSDKQDLNGLPPDPGANFAPAYNLTGEPAPRRSQPNGINSTEVRSSAPDSNASIQGLPPMGNSRIDLSTVSTAKGVFRGDEGTTDGQLVGKRQAMLDAARQALWEGDAASAERIYQQTTVIFPRDPKVFGEVGDFYFETGQKAAAARAYYQAGELFAEAGDRLEAERMVNVLLNKLEQTTLAHRLSDKLVDL